MRKSTFVLAGWVAVAAILGTCVLAKQAQAVLVVELTEQFTNSKVTVDGVIEDESVDSSITDGGKIGQAESVASFGSLLSNGARTAARSSDSEIAVNAQFADTIFATSRNYIARSESAYHLQFFDDFALFPVVGQFEFFLPPTVLELQGNGELPNEVLEARVSATVRTESPLSGSFVFEAELVGSYNDFDTLTPTVNVTLSPLDVDISPLLNPTVTVSPPGFFTRTITVEFPAFTGFLNVGPVPIGDHRIFYSMDAEVRGQASRSSAIASINDPFRLTGDPVMGVTLFPVDGVFDGNGNAVPEPVTATLGLMGLGVLSMATRRRAVSMKIS